MNREIKFRAWIKSENGWASDSLAISLNGELGWTHFDEFHIQEPTDIALMQYTGFKDCNGKEIYEGDILKTRICRHGVPTKDGKSIEVFGGDGLDVVYAKWDEYRLAEFKTDSHSTSFSLPKEDATYQGRGKILEWESVGNIYENPELLKEIEK